MLHKRAFIKRCKRIFILRSPAEAIFFEKNPRKNLQRPKTRRNFATSLNNEGKESDNP